MEDVAKDQREEAAMSGVHPSHKTRFSDASSFDEVCVKCGATDILNGGWGELANPCSKEHSEEERWATPSSPSEAEWIKGASIRYADGRTVCEDDATRHEQLLGKHGIARDYIDGFLTNTGRFVDRMEAARIAFAAAQIPEPIPELYSEDLSRGMHRMPSEAEELAKLLDKHNPIAGPNSVFRRVASLLRKQDRDYFLLEKAYTAKEDLCAKQAERIRELEDGTLRAQLELLLGIKQRMEALGYDPNDLSEANWWSLQLVNQDLQNELASVRAQLAAAQEREGRLKG